MSSPGAVAQGPPSGPAVLPVAQTKCRKAEGRALRYRSSRAAGRGRSGHGCVAGGCRSADKQHPRAEANLAPTTRQRRIVCAATRKAGTLLEPGGAPRRTPTLGIREQYPSEPDQLKRRKAEGRALRYNRHPHRPLFTLQVVGPGSPPQPLPRVQIRQNTGFRPQSS
jgi:hypothetical protein